MGGYDPTKPNGGMKPKPSPAGRVAAAIRKARAPKHPNAKTFTDGQGNLRQIGTGKILKPASDVVGHVPQGASAPGAPGKPKPKPGSKHWPNNRPAHLWQGGKGDEAGGFNKRGRR